MKDKLITILFMAVLLVFMTWGIISADRTVSEAENRKLAAVPELSWAGLISGELMADFESYASDQFPARDAWVDAKNMADIALGKTDNGRVYYGKNGNLFQIDDIDVNQLGKNIGYINDFYERLKLEYPDVTMEVMPIPSAWNVEGSLLPAYAPVADEDGAIGLIRNGLSEGIVFCDPTEALKAAFEYGEYVYYRTDHHWTTYGAYLGYREWAGRIGLIPLDEGEFTVTTVSADFLGTGDSKAGLPWAKPDTIRMYDRKGFDDVKMYVPGKQAEEESSTGSRADGQGNNVASADGQGNDAASADGQGNNAASANGQGNNAASANGQDNNVATADGQDNNATAANGQANIGALADERSNTGIINADQTETLYKTVSGMYDESMLSAKDKYAYFLGGNYPVVRIDTDTGNGKTLLVVKDSFANCFVPFLTSHYEHIVLLDLRYYKDGLTDFFTEDEMKSVLLLYGAVQLANDRNLFYLRMDVN